MSRLAAATISEATSTQSDPSEMKMRRRVCTVILLTRCIRTLAILQRSSPTFSISFLTVSRQSPSDDLALILSTRQNPQDLTRDSQPTISSLGIPQCALPCYITALTTDGCASETDFPCHCDPRRGKIMAIAKPCVAQECSDRDAKAGIAAVRKGCEASGVDPGDGDGEDSSTISTTNGESSTRSTSSTSVATPTPTSFSSSNLISSSEPSATYTSTSTATSTSMFPSSPTYTPTPPPTNTPLALLPSARQLSPAAKAAISLSLSLLFAAILLATILYIRRLKRDLRAAQAAAGVPEAVWRAHISTAAAPGPIGRRKSWSGGSRRGRGRSAPSSPLSPRGMYEGGGDGDGVVKKQKKKERGHVLSVVVERVEEEDIVSPVRTIHEPVPGQREGLVDPLELDGEGTGIVELPTSITPRTRSRERSVERTRERGRSFGERERDAEKVRYA